MDDYGKYRKMFGQFLLICLINWYLREKKIYFKLDIFFKNKESI